METGEFLEQREPLAWGGAGMAQGSAEGEARLRMPSTGMSCLGRWDADTGRGRVAVQGPVHPCPA